ncbi:MAG: hypothetical protein JSS35_04440 [Proteobacteria bacterium]|nr:hypothetical protein [Pseudomonadota bacterium]
MRYSEALGRAICARVALGESVAAVCRDAGMPHSTTVYDWTRAHPGFGAALAAAQREARVAQRLADRAAAAKRWGADGAADGAFGVLRDGRGRWSTFTPELGEAICWRLANGESLKSIGLDPAMPAAATVLYWARRYPAFGDAYAEARALMADSLSDMALEVAMTTNPREVWADKLRVDTIRWMAARQAPHKYCERLQAAVELEAIRREAGDGEGLTVIVKHHSEITPEEEAAHDATERAWEARRGRR